MEGSVPIEFGPGYPNVRHTEIIPQIVWALTSVLGEREKKNPELSNAG